MNGNTVLGANSHASHAGLSVAACGKERSYATYVLDTVTKNGHVDHPKGWTYRRHGLLLSVPGYFVNDSVKRAACFSSRITACTKNGRSYR
jgi:hypothetical protein